MKNNKCKGVRTWVEVDSKAIKKNLKLFRGLLGRDVKVCSVVKSNAYGHCLFDFSKVMEKYGVDWLAVDTILEGIRLRKEGVKKPILVLGYTLPENLKKAADKNISITISGRRSLKDALNYKGRKKLKIHLKFDTGMNRQGFGEGDLPYIFRVLKSKGAEKLVLEGIYTHFADAKDPNSPVNTLTQISVFERIKESFLRKGFEPMVHAAATAGTINFPDSHYNMVRIGIGFFGLWPSEKTKDHASLRIPLEPVLSWKSIVADIKKTTAGSGFGYGFTETVSKDTDFAIIPIGYWHGYPRSLSSKGEVLIRGRRAKVLGLISMDIIVVDISEIKGVRVGDEVTLLGRDGKDEVSADELAYLSGTTNYEFVTRINPLIKKIYK